MCKLKCGKRGRRKERNGRKAKIDLLVVCTSVLLLIVGCKGRVEEKVEEEIVLKTVSMFGGTTPSAKIYEDINEKFMKKYENVTIEDDSQICDEEWKTKVAVSFAVGDDPMLFSFLRIRQQSCILATDKLVSLEEIQRISRIRRRYT